MEIDVTRVWLDDNFVYIQTKEGLVKNAAFSDFPLLRDVSPEQRSHFECGKYGIRWEELDEDLSYEGLFTDS